jgi:hypothetical protein
VVTLVVGLIGDELTTLGKQRMSASAANAVVQCVGQGCLIGAVVVERSGP